jgi:hypothetical protein
MFALEPAMDDRPTSFACCPLIAQNGSLFVGIRSDQAAIDGEPFAADDPSDMQRCTTVRRGGARYRSRGTAPWLPVLDELNIIHGYFRLMPLIRGV